MNSATKIPGLPALTADLLQSNGCLVDNPIFRFMEVNGDGGFTERL